MKDTNGLTYSIPEFSIPVLSGKINLGNIIKGKESINEKDYASIITDLEYRLDTNDLSHAIISGCAITGKSRLTQRLVKEFMTVKKKAEKPLQVICLEERHKDWSRFAENEKLESYKVYSLSNIDKGKIKINPWKIPKGIYPKDWIDRVINAFCYTHGILELGKKLIEEIVYKLYDETGVFEALEKPNWQEVVPELSKKVCFNTIYASVEKMKSDAPYERLSNHFSSYTNTESVANIIFGTDEGVSVDELIDDTEMIIFELKEHEYFKLRNFIHSIIAFYTYKNATTTDKKETILVIEDSEYIIANSPEFEQIYKNGAENGMCVFATTLHLAYMPQFVLDNAGMMFTGKVKLPQECDIVTKLIAKGDTALSNKIRNWLPRAPIGWFLCQTNKDIDCETSKPVLVKIRGNT